MDIFARRSVHRRIVPLVDLRQFLQQVAKRDLFFGVQTAEEMLIVLSLLDTGIFDIPISTPESFALGMFSFLNGNVVDHTGQG